MIDVLLYVLIGVAALQAVASQRLVGAEQATGPAEVLLLVTFLRLVLISGWIWFGIWSGYWQIAVLVGVGTLATLAGMNAKKAAQ